MSEPVTAEDVRAAQQDEYGQYVAATTIYLGGARAFNEGDPVPASHVTRGVVNPDQVVKTAKKG